MDVFVVIPRLAVEEELHKAHAAFDKPPRDEAAGAVFLSFVLVNTVQLFGGFAFAADIERFLGGGLHAGGQFEAGDARLEGVFTGQCLGLIGVKAV